MLDYIRIACAVPEVRVGDVKKNAEDICRFLDQADAGGADLLLFPELALTGYTCQDLFFQETLLSGACRELNAIAVHSGNYPKLTAVVGLPVIIGQRLYNCAAVISGGKVRGLVPKTGASSASALPEDRWFAPGRELTEKSVSLGKELGEVPVYPGGLFRLGDGAMMGIEIGSDLFAPISPAALLALSGAEVILNPAAFSEAAGKAQSRRDWICHQSAALNCIYVSCGAGYTESTQDMIFSGQSLMAEKGRILKENQETIAAGCLLLQDCDLGKVRADRLRKKDLFPSVYGDRMTQVIPIGGDGLRGDGSLYPLKKLPFIPSEKNAREKRCREIFQMQVTGLKQRLKVIGNANAVIGISGGLDSTLALLVAVEAMHQLGRPASDVYGVTMPCFGTSDRTYRNAWDLMEKLGISSKEISIREAVSLHFQEIGHDESVHNATFENAQARERTQILMDYASVVGGIVVGTGDLSELALGWCTYNGDHMSMYGVNGSVPKTLIRWIIDTISETETFAPCKAVLQDILDTPISPELLPPDASGKIAQQTEDLVGPYALHDFFLYHVLRFGFAPEKIETMACRAFREDFDAATVRKWLKVFYRRFFTQQFKRNCMPDGVKVGSVTLGPRGDWRMPSDASASAWLEALESEPVRKRL